MLVTVCTGSRYWPQSERGAAEHALTGADAVIVGDADGFDRLVRTIAAEWDVISLGGPRGFVADWQGLGKKAGPARNGVMVQRALVEQGDGAEIRCYAAPLAGSVGTHDCIRQMRAAGFVVAVWNLGEWQVG